MTIIKKDTPNKLKDMDFDYQLKWAQLVRSKILGSKKADKKIQEFKRAHGMLDAAEPMPAAGGGGAAAVSAVDVQEQDRGDAQGLGASDAGGNTSHAQREEERRGSKDSASKEGGRGI